jgi:hypothetical protein
MKATRQFQGVPVVSLQNFKPQRVEKQIPSTERKNKVYFPTKSFFTTQNKAFVSKPYPHLKSIDHDQQDMAPIQNKSAADLLQVGSLPRQFRQLSTQHIDRKLQMKPLIELKKRERQRIT